MKQELPANLPHDILWGVSAISAYIKRKNSQTYYLIRSGKIPAKKLGPKTICARRSELDRALANLNEGVE